MQEEQATLPRGTVLHGHYIIESLLGRGDFGNVYLIRDQRNKKKLFALAELINPNEQEGYRLTLEYVSLTLRNHRALPQAQYGFNDEKLGRAYLLMNYIQEPNLEILRLQQPEKRFPLAQVMAIVAPIIRAVTSLHHKHPPVIHQNIKPTNIIVSQTAGGPALVVLGIYKKQGATTKPVPYFAPGYGAPEQYRGEFSTRTDIYSLGATCYTLLTGIVPHDALSRSTQLDSTGSDPLKPINEVFPAIPASIALAIQRAMSLDAYNRYSSVELFREALWSPRKHLLLAISPSKPSISSPPPVASKPAFARPATVSDPKQPRTPRSWKLGALWPFASKQAVKQPVTVSVPKQPRPPRSLRLSALLPGTSVPTPESERAVEQAATMLLPKPPLLASMTDSVKEPEDLEATEPRLPVVPKPDAEKGREDLDVEEAPPVAPTGFKGQGDLDVVKPPPRPSGGVRAPISLRKLGVLFVVLALLIGLGVGASFLSRARGHPAAHSAIPASRAASPASTPTSAPVASSYPILAGTYSGTLYDMAVNASTSMSLTVTQQNQGSFSGYLRLGPLVKGSGPLGGTIDTAKILQFTVTDAAGNATLFFEGGMQSATSLSGDYYQCGPAPVQGGQCSRAPGGYGIWSAAQASSGQSSPKPPPLKLEGE